MKLVIGGYAQGKLDYVKENYDMQDSVILDGKIEMTHVSCKKMIVNHLHSWVRSSLEQGKCPEEEIEEFLEQNPDCILISDEVGNGIVPMEPFEREYRERLGRILIRLAKRAESVERVICGIGQRIK